MEYRKLQTQSLDEALTEMAVAETCFAPDNCTPDYVRARCSSLKRDKDMLFTTRTIDGVMLITRLK